MTDRQRRFLEALLSGPRGVRSNATRAAEAAGYAWPGKQGPRLRTFPEVAAALRADRERREREWRERSRERAKAAADALFRLIARARRRRRRRPECM